MSESKSLQSPVGEKCMSRVNETKLLQSPVYVGHHVRHVAVKRQRPVTVVKVGEEFWNAQQRSTREVGTTVILTHQMCPSDR